MLALWLHETCVGVQDRCPSLDDCESQVSAVVQIPDLFVRLKVGDLPRDHLWCRICLHAEGSTPLMLSWERA